MDRAGHMSKSINPPYLHSIYHNILLMLYRNNSLSLEQLRHLSLHQALADLAHFIRYQKSQNPTLTHSKVLLIGGSYSGSMVAWMTQLYPELIAASWASSAPLLAKADFFGKCKFDFILNCF